VIAGGARGTRAVDGSAAGAAGTPLRVTPARTARRAATSLRALLSLLAVVAVAWSAGAPAARGASPFQPDDEATTASDTRPVVSPRLRRAAEALRTDPLYVDPELAWTLDGRARSSMRAALRAARVPVLVAVLPSLDEDESGGDTRRVLQVLQRLLRRDAVYITVDQRGWIDLASMGIPLDLGIPYELTMPRSTYDRPADADADGDGDADGKASADADAADRAGDVPPASHASLPGRLREMLRIIAAAGPGTPNGPVDDPDPIDPLPGRGTPNTTGDVVAAGVVGAVLGLGLAGVVLAVRRAVLRRSPVATVREGRGGRAGRGGPSGARNATNRSAPSGGTPGSGRPGTPRGGGGAKRRGRPRRGGRRRGRRGA
jgi:hypothetical protein